MQAYIIIYEYREFKVTVQQTGREILHFMVFRFWFIEQRPRLI